ncbi:MAG: ATP-binding protein [Cytophagales bacterium]|nr:ATP-binding protein [Cytophagales bacterium]
MTSGVNNIIRIAITGPESTGKSSLAKKLAGHFGTVWVPEYARAYLDKLKRAYTERDLLKIAKGQINSEREIFETAKRMIFYDTELLVIKIWANHKYGRIHPWILSNYNKISYDLYLLTYPDLPWEYDPLRENPEKGNYFFSIFEKELIARKAKYKIIRGNHDERMIAAIDFIEKRLNF